MGGKEGMKLDRWGYKVNTTSDACIAAINSYYEQVLSYGRKRSVILEAVAEDEGCVLANILAAEYLIYADPPRASPLIEVAKSHLGQATPYERAVFDCISNWISKNRDDDVAFDLHSKLLKDFPRDLASLKRAQILCFYMGRMDPFIDLAQQVLPHNEQESYIHGMLAFALLELGRMSDAEEAAKKGFKINPNDAWAQHCMCHVLQYQCRFKEAIDFMEECSESWNSCSSFMLTHNWWHVSLCYLESHSSISKVIDIYNKHIWHELEKHDAAGPEVYLNALGLLLRLYVRDQIDVAEERLKILVSHLTDQNTWHLEWHLDLLILWALACAGEISKAEELLSGLKSNYSKMSEKRQLSMLKALLLAEAMLEYGRGNYERAVELFGPEFDIMSYKVIGASDEQLDVFNEVWYILLLNTGQVDKAVEVMEKQIKKRDGAPFLWLLLERGYKAMAKSEAAAAARDKVQALESAYS